MVSAVSVYHGALLVFASDATRRARSKPANVTRNERAALRVVRANEQRWPRFQGRFGYYSLAPTYLAFMFIRIVPLYLCSFARSLLAPSLRRLLTSHTSFRVASTRFVSSRLILPTSRCSISHRSPSCLRRIPLFSDRSRFSFDLKQTPCFAYPGNARVTFSSNVPSFKNASAHARDAIPVFKKAILKGDSLAAFHTRVRIVAR